MVSRRIRLFLHSTAFDNISVELGNAHWRLGRTEEAYAAYSRIIALDPVGANYTYVNRGILSYNLGDFEAAIADFSVAISRESDNAERYWMRASAYDDAGRPHMAIPDLDRALELEPTLVRAHFSRGIVNGNLENYEAALTDYSRALELSARHSVPT